MLTRRGFLGKAVKASVIGATTPLWSSLLSERAFAQGGGSYKALVFIHMTGGNDANNTVIPLGASEYNAYSSIRKSIALTASSCLPLVGGNAGQQLGLHPALKNVAALYNNGRAAVIANVGPIARLATKAQVMQDSSLIPEGLLSHPAGMMQWASAGTSASATSGWGGRIADIITDRSGVLPPLLNTSDADLFGVGESVQAISVQSTSAAYLSLPTALNASIARIAAADATSGNRLVAAAAKLRSSSMAQQTLIDQAKSYGTMKTVFPTSQLGTGLQTVAQILAGRSVTSASRQMFYCKQGGSYDTHASQLSAQSSQLTDFDTCIGAFMQALDELGLSNQVLLCTSSDFNRTMQANSTGGTDHAWGTHQMVFGAVSGGRVIGALPPLELGGSADLYQQGVWIPTQSVTQLAAGIGKWMGLSASQLNGVFPDLVNFSGGPLSL